MTFKNDPQVRIVTPNVNFISTAVKISQFGAFATSVSSCSPDCGCHPDCTCDSVCDCDTVCDCNSHVPPKCTCDDMCIDCIQH